jgi:hypothetical protein
MTVFTNAIMPLLNDYKGILRRNMPLEEANSKVKRLQLHRKQLIHVNDVILYQHAINVINDIKQQMKYYEWAHGLTDFMHHIEDTLNEYQLENNQVVHPKQKAAQAIIDAIQLINYPNQNSSIKQKIQNCIEAVSKYGTPEQRDMIRQVVE